MKKLAASVFHCVFDDGTTHVGCCLTCPDDALCTCTAKRVLGLHCKVQHPSELRTRLRSGQQYVLAIVLSRRARPTAMFKLVDASADELRSKGITVLAPETLESAASRHVVDDGVADALEGYVSLQADGTVLPSPSQLAHMLKCNKHDVAVALRLLVSMGELRKEPAGACGKRHRYIVSGVDR